MVSVEPDCFPKPNQPLITSQSSCTRRRPTSSGMRQASAIRNQSKTGRELSRVDQMAGERINRLVRSLKIASRAPDPEPQRVNVNDIVESALELAKTEFRSRITVETDFGPLPESVLAPESGATPSLTSDFEDEPSLLMPLSLAGLNVVPSSKTKCTSLSVRRGPLLDCLGVLPGVGAKTSPPRST